MNFWWIWTQNLVPMSYITYSISIIFGRIWIFFLWLIWIMAKIDIFETFVLLYGNLRIFPSLRNLRQGQNPLPKMGLTRIHCPKWVLLPNFCFRCYNNPTGDAGSYAEQSYFSLQPQVLRKRYRQLWRHQPETFCYAGKWSIWRKIVQILILQGG